MEDVLRWSLFILGTCAIAGVLVHGLWVSRKSPNKIKNKTDSKPSAKYRFSAKSAQGGTRNVVQPRFSPDDDMSDAQGTDDHWPSSDELSIEEPVDLDNEQFDELGLSSVRVVNSQGKAQQAAVPDSPASQPANAMPEADPVPPAEAPGNPVAESPSKIYASVVTQPKPEYTAAQSGTYAQSAQDIKKAGSLPEPPPFLLKKTEDIPAGSESLELENSPSASAEPVETKSRAIHKASLAEQARNKKHSRQVESARGKRKEPKLGEDQLDIDFEKEGEVEPQQNVSAKSKNVSSEPPAQEVLVLNVKAPDDKPIFGSALLPMLLTLGFKFGDQDIFHRHVNANGKGPVLFSLANMFKPGVFDIDNLENFTTQGVSLFMILPIEGDPHQVFNMMHNAARKIADEFHGQILDGRRSVLSKQGLQQYVERIREFERKRITNR